MNLKNLILDVKEAWIDYPGLQGFEVLLVANSRKELAKLQKDCVYQKLDKKTREHIPTLDEEKFVHEFSKKVIKDWKGLKLKYLEDLVLSDIGDSDPEEEMEYSQENAEDLLRASSVFDGWVNDVVFDLENFRGHSEGDSVE